MTNLDSTLKFGVFVPQGWKLDLTDVQDPYEQYETMTRVAQAADRLPGWDSIWVYDHFHTVPEPTLETTFECWSITAGLARDTQRVKIGQMVTCNGYRHPAYLAKVASTVDVMSNGRLLFGIGAGWHEHEWRAYGYGFPEVPVRMGMFREACEIIHRMWTEEYPRFQGKYYQIEEPINEPKGVQKPHPPLWIGGGGEKVTLKLVAQWGDATNINVSDPNEVRHKFDVLRRHCEAVGRDYNEITRSWETVVYLIEKESDRDRALDSLGGNLDPRTIMGTPQQVVERLTPMAEVGVQYFVIYIPRVAYELDQVERFAQEVIPQLQ